MASAFPKAEYERRFERAKAMLVEAGLSGCISTAPEDLYYLGGYDGHTHFSEQALIVGVEDAEPTLVLRDVDVDMAYDAAWFSDLRTYRFGAGDAAALIADAVRARGLRGKVGLDLGSYALPGRYAMSLTRALAPLEVVDATELVGKLRTVKSALEMEYVREAARYAEIGRERLREKARSGVTENAIAGAVDCAMREAGAEYPAMPTWVTSGERTLLGHGSPTNRKLRAGDLLRMETAGVCRRYHVLSIQSLAIGEAEPRAREVYERSMDALRAGAAVIAPGEPVSRAEVAALESLRAAGLGDRDIMRFGYGLAAAYPPSWLEPLHIIRESERPFEPGMVFCLHVAFSVREAGFGILVGGTYALGEAGLECLAGGDFALETVF